MKVAKPSVNDSLPTRTPEGDRRLAFFDCSYNDGRGRKLKREREIPEESRRRGWMMESIQLNVLVARECTRAYLPHTGDTTYGKNPKLASRFPNGAFRH